MTDQTFEAFGFAEPLSRALMQCGYATPTPIQVQALPPQLEGRDLLGLAETGSGKTATFLLPILQKMAANPVELNWKQVSALILAPTRELAIQIDAEAASLSRNMNIRRAVVLGGVSKGPQINALKRGVHILVATPGRLLDHVNMRSCDLSGVHTLVLDEADRMFDMGFIRDIKKIVSMIPMKRRTALFSATMPTEIKKFAYDVLQDPYRVDLSTKSMVVDRIDQKVMIVRTAEKQSRLHTILADPEAQRVIVFTRTKRGADRVAERLAMASISASAFHGNKAQNARQRALNDFMQGHVRVLVATDIAARGIDVSNITHVINFDMPLDPETYVHRVGRTARKGTSGIAISLCDPSERPEIVAIERMMKQKIDVIEDVGGDILPMPEKRPHHSHDAPRREGAHRKGPRQERGPMRGQDRGQSHGRSSEGRTFDRHDDRRGGRDDSAPTRSGGFNPADTLTRGRPDADRNAPQRASALRPPRAEGDRPDRRSAHAHGSRPEGARDGARDGARHVGRDGGRDDARHQGPRRDNAPDDGRPSRHARGDARHDDRRSERPSQGGAGAHPAAKPQSHHASGKPQRDGHRSDAARPHQKRTGDANWHGQQPPKFLKQRETSQSEAVRPGRPDRKPAA